MYLFYVVMCVFANIYAHSSVSFRAGSYFLLASLLVFLQPPDLRSVIGEGP